ncbi:recombination protein NinG, partial [Denitromonas sp.]|uniref:recombination protein NinG n=1 Tax=Denitromonas sp. TaxID=2734609 RepID=UPI002FDCC457
MRHCQPGRARRQPDCGADIPRHHPAAFSESGGCRVKPKKCKSCRQVFDPSRPMQAACSIDCAKAIARRKREKIEAAETRRRKEAIKSRPELMREAQTAFNAYIRARDADLPCISCGRHHN